MNDWPDTEQVLSRFRHWLDETRTEAESIEEEAITVAGIDESVGLFQLFEGLTAVRHEVKLLTKAARGTEERSESTLLSMQAAIEQFRAVETNETRAAEQATRPLVEGLVDLDESLRRGRVAIEKARNRLLQELSGEMAEMQERFESAYRSQPWWRRVLCRPWHLTIKDIYSERTLNLQRNVFDSLLEGYGLIEGRLQRTLDEHVIIRMQCVGRTVDPNSMTVLETISDPSRPPGMVVEEVRPGYYWNTSVFRFAEVKAVGDR